MKNHTKMAGRIMLIKFLLTITVTPLIATPVEISIQKESAKAEQFVNDLEFDSAIVVLRNLCDFTENNRSWDSYINSSLHLLNVYRLISNFAELDSCVYILENHKAFRIQENKNYYAELLHQKATAIGDRGEYERAIEILEQAVGIRTKANGPQDTLLAKSLNNIGTYHYYLGDLQKANRFYLEALALAELAISQQDDVASYIQNIGIIFARLGDFEKALVFFNRNLKMNLKSLDENDPAIGQIYLNLGQLHSLLGHFKDAINFYNLAEKIFVDAFGSNYVSLGSVYQNKGIIYVHRSDPEAAEKYFINALNIYNEVLNHDHPNIAHIYNNLGFVYLTKKNYDQAIYFFNKSLEIQSDVSSRTILMRNLATVYYELGDMTSADRYHNLSVDIAKNELGVSHYDYGQAMEYYGEFLLKIDELKKAEKYLLDALKFHTLNFAPKSIRIASINQLLGEYYHRSGDLINSLKYYQKSIIANNYSFFDENIFVNPEAGQPISEITSLNALLSKAAVFSDLYKKQDSAIYLKASIDCFEASLVVFEGLRSKIRGDSKFILTDQSKTQFDQAYKAFFDYYNLTGDTEVLANLFRFIEKNKAAILRTSMQGVEALKFGGVLPEHLAVEADLNERINGYKQLIYDQKNSFSLDSSKIILWERNLFDLSNRYDSLLNYFGQAYPNYFELKHNHEVIEIKEVQAQVNEGQVIVEYVMLDSLLYTYLITPDQIKIIETVLDSDFYKNLEIVQGAINFNFSNHSLNDFKEYVLASNELYKILFEHIHNDVQGKSLVFIPDGILGYLSFEALVTKVPDFERIDYRSLSYLIKEFPISYSYSSTLLFGNTNSSATSNRVLAFAPSYENFDNDNLGNSSVRKIIADLKPLPNARKEVKNVSGIFKSKVFVDEMANEENFKLNSAYFDVLHLAMHTILDDEDPMYSKLVFTQDGDSIEDGLLNTYEIYDLDLKAQLAVLSACNTGGGKVRNGEGIMSLARGFIYAGVPSIIMTLWEIDDKSGADIMTGFYEYLETGISKDVALKNAKLDYLASSSQLRAHPYFWSAFVSIGNSAPLKSNNFNNILLYIGAFIILLILIAILKKPLRKSE